MNPKTRAVMFSSKTDQHATPRAFAAEQVKRFGITLDVCADASNAVVPRYFTKEQNGLSQDWVRQCQVGNCACLCHQPSARFVGESSPERSSIQMPRRRTDSTQCANSAIETGPEKRSANGAPIQLKASGSGKRNRGTASPRGGASGSAIGLSQITSAGASTETEENTTGAHGSGASVSRGSGAPACIAEVMGDSCKTTSSHYRPQNVRVQSPEIWSPPAPPAISGKAPATHLPGSGSLGRSPLCSNCRARAWGNFPYGRRIGDWIEKAAETAAAGGFVVCLLPARTDTQWWHRYVIPYGRVEFIRGRLKFGDAKNSAPFPSALVIFGDGA